MSRVSLGEGQPFFFTSDIRHVRKHDNTSVNEYDISGYSEKQGQYILLFRSDNIGERDAAMEKLARRMSVEYL